MNIYFAQNIKKLRKEREMTQEAVADCLGVSFQTISKWERCESYPDITILPVIASFFGVSIDDLLGVNKAKQEELIHDYLDEYNHLKLKDTSLAYDRMSIAVKEFPADFRILLCYMEVLLLEKSKGDNKPLIYDQIVSIYDNIQNNCTVDSIRMRAKRLMCNYLHSLYYVTKNQEYQQRTERILSEMPLMIDGRDYLSTMFFLDNDNQRDACQNAIDELLALLNAVTINHYGINSRRFATEHQICLLQKMLSVMDIYNEDGHYGKSYYLTIMNYGHLGRLYFEIGDNENALKYLNECAILARKYDNLPDISQRNSLIFDGSYYEKAVRGKTMCERMKTHFLDNYSLSDEFKQTYEFKKIIEILS